jgi:kelch-like protein 10
MTNGSTIMSSGEKYDPKTDTWSPIPDMSMKKCSMATAVIYDKIFVFGGKENKATNRVECFNDEENEWFVYSRDHNIITSYTGSF